MDSLMQPMHYRDDDDFCKSKPRDKNAKKFCNSFKRFYLSWKKAFANKWKTQVVQDIKHNHTEQQNSYTQYSTFTVYNHNLANTHSHTNKQSNDWQKWLPKKKHTFNLNKVQITFMDFFIIFAELLRS